MTDLHNSRWAPSQYRSQNRSPQRPNPTTTPTPQQRRARTRREEFDRFTRLLRRLHWKSHHLVISQGLVQGLTHHDSTDQQQRTEKDLREAETMFKIDFFEWYVLLERGLVHLLAVFGVSVSASHFLANSTTEDAAAAASSSSTSSSRPSNFLHGVVEKSTILGDARIFSHRFHANVLQALDHDANNPLHPVLGTGDVRNYIGIAKEFRNRWKDVDVSSTPNGDGDERDLPRRYQKMLHDLKLEEMLQCILTQLETAKEVAWDECVRFERDMNTDRVGRGDDWMSPEEDVDARMEMDDQGGPWEAMPDAMEWDAF